VKLRLEKREACVGKTIRRTDARPYSSSTWKRDGQDGLLWVADDQ